MATFLTDLLNSIFTPGPTPSLLLATNASFACLQLVLFILLIATYSIHFVILSFLCAGLWGGINWFVRELEEFARLEEEKKRQELKERERSGGPGGPGGGDSGDETDKMDKMDKETVVGGEGSGREGKEKQGLLRPRASQGSNFGSKSEVSTEDEWEKVSGSQTLENEKDQ